MNPIYRTYAELSGFSELNNNISFDNRDNYKEDDLITVQSLQHKKKLLSENYLVVVDVYGDHCHPCKEILPHFVMLSKKYNVPGLCLLVKENAENGFSPNINAVPAFLFYVNGNSFPIHTVLGGQMDEVEKTINIILSRKK